MSWGVTGLEVRIGDEIALQGVDLDIDTGSITAVIGGDGAGKTTLARVLARLIRPASGRVDLPPQQLVGYQPASSGTWPDLSVTENLRFVADAHRMTPAQARSRIDELVEATGLVGAEDRMAANLSGGMRQKLGVAMAMMGRPRLLVLDEPTTGVDPVSRSEMWRLVSRAAADGAAVMLTTTYLDEAARAAVVLALEDRCPLAVGRPDQLKAMVPGKIWGSSDRPVEETRWRRGPDWRVWTRADAIPAGGGEELDPDLTDLLTAATIARDTP